MPNAKSVHFSTFILLQDNLVLCNCTMTVLKVFSIKKLLTSLFIALVQLGSLGSVLQQTLWAGRHSLKDWKYKNAKLSWKPARKSQGAQ